MGSLYVSLAILELYVDQTHLKLRQRPLLLPVCATPAYRVPDTLSLACLLRGSQERTTVTNSVFLVSFVLFETWSHCAPLRSLAGAPV